MINKSLIPTFGLLSSHYYHTFAKNRDYTFINSLLPESLLYLGQKSHSLFPCFLEH